MFKNLKKMGSGLDDYLNIKNEDFKKIMLLNGLNEIKPVGYVGNIPIIKNNYLMNSFGAIFAMLAYDKHGKYYILIDSLFEKLSINTRKFTLAHELGHKQLQHLEKAKQKSGLINDINNEYEADEFALKCYDYKVAVEAIEELVDISSTVMDNAVQYIYFKNTMKKRKKHLMK